MKEVLAKLRPLASVQAQTRLDSVRVFVYSRIYQIAKKIVYQVILTLVRRVRIPSLAPIIPATLAGIHRTHSMQAKLPFREIGQALQKSIMIFPEYHRRGSGRIKHRINATALVFFGFIKNALEALELAR